MKNKGFTLIELVVVIVILGILAATALPKFIDFKSDAADAAVRGVAAGITSASSINYAGKAMSKTVTPSTLSGAAASDVCTTSNLGALIQGGMPPNYAAAAVTGDTNTCSANGFVNCAVTNNGVSPAVSAAAAVTCY